MTRPLTKGELDCAWVAFVAHSPCYHHMMEQQECWEMTVEGLEETGEEPAAGSRHGIMMAECRRLIDDHRKWVEGD